MDINRLCYIKMKYYYENNYDESIDILYHYFKSIIDGNQFDTYLFADEFENLIGIREHDDIVHYVIKHLK